MGLGVQLGHIGSTANATGVSESAVAFEQAGYDSLWVLDRLLVAQDPQTLYPGTVDGRQAPDYERVLDPITALAAAAAVTHTIGIGTSVLVAPWYRPAMLARALATLDILSNGRLTVGLGLGWSADEFQAVGVPQTDLGTQLDETLDVMDAMFAPDPISYHGAHMTIPSSTTGIKPVRAGGPPVLLAAFSPAGMDRIARRASGWNPAGLPVAALSPMWGAIRGMAEGHGRNPDDLRLVVRANLDVRAAPISGERKSYSGSISQIADDLNETEQAGAHQVILGCFDGRSLPETIDIYGRVASALR
jgi:probable F420-dependent oxidoreductase